MGLFSDDSDIYCRAAMTWMLSALVAVEILWGWIRGRRLRSKLVYFMVLVYSMRLGRHALKVRAFLANIPESRRFRCPAPVGVPSVGECILMEGVYIRDLQEVATSSFYLTVVVFLLIWKKRRPPRPRVPGWRGVGTILIEILLFVLCVLTCAYSLPVLIVEWYGGIDCDKFLIGTPRRLLFDGVKRFSYLVASASVLISLGHLQCRLYHRV